MTALPSVQIAAAARSAGFSGSALVTAVAIAYAESGGNPTATHTNTNGSVDYGLWQINSVHGALLREGSWSNPTDNARMAYKVYSGAGNRFTPWSTYKSGRYLAFVSVAQRAVSGTGSTLPDSEQSGGASAQQVGLSVPNPLDAVSAFAKLAAVLTSGKFWLRVAMFIGGAYLLYMGLKSVTTLDNKITALGTKVAAAVATDGASLAATKGAGAVAKVAK